MQDPDTWVDQYGDYLYRFALSRIQDPETAQDLVQETFLAALDSKNKFEGRSTERTWLTGILRHKIIDYLQKQVREQSFADIDDLSDGVEEFFDKKGTWKLGPAEWVANPTTLLEQKEFLEIFYRCLSEIGDRLSRAFQLREMDGLSTDEICKLLNITATNYWVTIYRARMRMRYCLEVNWFGNKSVKEN